MHQAGGAAFTSSCHRHLRLTLAGSPWTTSCLLVVCPTSSLLPLPWGLGSGLSAQDSYTGPSFVHEGKVGQTVDCKAKGTQVCVLRTLICWFSKFPCPCPRTLYLPQARVRLTTLPGGCLLSATSGGRHLCGGVVGEEGLGVQGACCFRGDEDCPGGRAVQFWPTLLPRFYSVSLTSSPCFFQIGTPHSLGICSPPAPLPPSLPQLPPLGHF